MILISGKSQIGSIAEVLAMIVVFVLILVATYYVTKYFGKVSSGSLGEGNIHVIETVRLAPEKYLQIVEVTERYFLLAVCKGSISLISELHKEDVKTKEHRNEKKPKVAFKELLQKAIKK